MKFFYLAPKTAFDSLHGTVNHRCVHDVSGDLAFGIVDFKHESERQDFLNLPGVKELPHHFSRSANPSGVVASLGQHGVGPQDSTFDTAVKIAKKFGGISVEDIL